MKMNGKNSLAGLLLSLVALISSTSTTIADYCCDFSPASSTSCHWDTTSFLTVPTDGNPNTATYYPNFYSPLPDPYYTYLQDGSGTISSVNEYLVFNTTTTFRWDYFYDSPSPASDGYLHVYVHNGIIKTLISSITVPYDKWQSITVVCDSTVNFCCGNQASMPCSITLEVAASLGSAGTTGLFAIGNIGTCSDGLTTTTRPPLPPPHPPTTECCDFNVDVCGMSGSDWYWSATLLPSLPVPNYDYYYLWTDINGATLYTYEIFNVQDGTTFSVALYATSPYVYFSFYFLPIGGTGINLMGTLNDVTGAWFSMTQVCYGCCYPYPEPCNGQIMVEMMSQSSPFVAAIDNAQVNSACQDSLPCCYFDDYDACNFANPGYGSYFWQWSGSSIPYNYVPPNNPNSDYEYFEITSPNPSAMSVVLQSPLISIPTTQDFIGSYYVKTPLGVSGVDKLEINFRELTTGIATMLGYLSDTAGAWELLTLTCSSVHGTYCQGFSTCFGYIQITAYVDALSDPLIFAIDSFEVGSTCSTFPGASNSTLLHFGHPSTK